MFFEDGDEVTHEHFGPGVVDGPLFGVLWKSNDVYVRVIFQDPHVTKTIHISTLKKKESTDA